MRYISRIIFICILIGWIFVALVVWRTRNSEMAALQGDTAKLLRADERGVNNIQAVALLTIGSQKIRIAVADTEILREKGLSSVSTLKEDEGMLFIFDTPAQHSFWMPDMHFPIDMIWIDANKKIIDVTKNAQPLKKDEKPKYYEPKSPAQYVLEVTAGFFDRNNLKEGMSVEW